MSASGRARTASIAAANSYLEVVAETVDLTSEDAVAALFSRHDKIRYLQHTAGISPPRSLPHGGFCGREHTAVCERVRREPRSHGTYPYSARLARALFVLEGVPVILGKAHD
jgi:hypothetical protein